MIPSSQLDLLLDNNSARTAFALCSKYEKNTDEFAVHWIITVNEHHGLSCMITAGTNKIVLDALSSARIQNILKPPGLSRLDSRDKIDGGV